MRVRSALVALVLSLAAARVDACSMAANLGDEHDLPPIHQSSDVVFVARLTGYSQFVPFGSQHVMGRVDYALLETLKGRPATQGALFEWTGQPAAAGVAPKPACGPWLVHADNAGEDYLVFASRAPGSAYLMPHHRSVRLDAATGESAKLLTFIRTLQRPQPTP